MLAFNEQMLREMLLIIINVLAFAGIMAYILYNPVRQYMKKRSEGIAGQLAEAEANLKESERLKAEYAEKLKAAETERDQLLETARKRSLEKESQIISKARKDAEAYKERAQKEIALEREKTSDNVKQQILEVSTLMTERFISKSLDTETQGRLFEECMRELGDAEWQS
ncbi:MAG: F0F1 ATP synthase subunit B [Clostridiales bacterium]|jgi:F-type H+-transporting ATPase subunit b|nr:F0F1 ATP synthase subunit B [Clostridiales bacterium]